MRLKKILFAVNCKKILIRSSRKLRRWYIYIYKTRTGCILKRNKIQSMYQNNTI